MSTSVPAAKEVIEFSHDYDGTIVSVEFIRTHDGRSVLGFMSRFYGHTLDEALDHEWSDTLHLDHDEIPQLIQWLNDRLRGTP